MSIQENETVIAAHDAISRAMGGMNTLHLGPLDYNIATTINDLREAIHLLVSIVPGQIVTDRLWKTVDIAPFQKVVWVRNKSMDAPIKATRGYARDGIVNKDMTLFTSVLTKEGAFLRMPGALVCPSEWTEATDNELDDGFDVAASAALLGRSTATTQAEG